jgi:hypothetical protein
MKALLSVARLYLTPMRLSCPRASFIGPCFSSTQFAGGRPSGLEPGVKGQGLGDDDDDHDDDDGGGGGGGGGDMMM